jgi:hypothetical protein
MRWSKAILALLVFGALWIPGSSDADSAPDRTSMTREAPAFHEPALPPSPSAERVSVVLRSDVVAPDPDPVGRRRPGGSSRRPTEAP